MHFDLIAKFLFMLVIANGTPILLTRIFGSTLSRPIDGGFKLPDGRPLLGPSKTIRGLVVSLVATATLAPLIEVFWATGLIIAALSMAGDLMSSFVKRRLGYPPSSRFTGLDQIPEALLPSLGGVGLMALSMYDVVLIVAIFFLGSLLLSWILFSLSIRRRPY